MKFKLSASCIFVALLLPLLAHGSSKEMEKNYKISSSTIERLVPDIGYALVTDMITVDGKSVDYMIRNEPEREDDSGWIFYGGGETQEYIDNPNNTSLMSVNTIANYDLEIINFLTYPVGTEIERNENGKLQVITPEVREPDVLFLPPVEKGNINITNEWSFDVSTRMVKRIDKGSLVVWRPGFTLWIDAYKPEDKDINARERKLLDIISPERINFESIRQDQLQKIRYELTEESGEYIQKSAYISGLTESQEIHITIYYDDPKSISEIDEIWNTITCECT
jgi:hypothetical protein